MKRLPKKMFLLLALGLPLITTGFSLLGPFKNGTAPNDWQGAGFGGRPLGLGYSLPGDIGGPMFPLEGYRWNVPVITYGFDESFIRYFGPEGMAAVSAAIQILNDLPPVSALSPDLHEYPTDIKQQAHLNFELQTVGLLDLKSFALSLILEEMGLAKPERFVWGLRSRTTFPTTTNYATINLNFDPLTLVPSRYVNGVLYHYLIIDAIGLTGQEWASAVEFYRPDPFYYAYSSVAGGVGSDDLEFLETPLNSFQTGFGFSNLEAGQYFSGLTRDDVGGLRYLYNPKNLVTERLLSDVTGGRVTGTGTGTGTTGSPWTPFFNNTNVFLAATNVIFNTNTSGTNLTVQGIRPGINKILFRKVEFDSLLGQILIPMTNKFTDTFITNGRPVIQAVQRAPSQPDILFLVQDLGLTAGGTPQLTARTTTASWQNNDAINGASFLGGPGVIAPPVGGSVGIFFSDVLPFYRNFDPINLEDRLAGSGFWGSFDGSTNEPVIYPRYLNISLRDLKNVALAP